MAKGYKDWYPSEDRLLVFMDQQLINKPPLKRGRHKSKPINHASHDDDEQGSENEDERPDEEVNDQGRVVNSVNIIKTWVSAIRDLQKTLIAMNVMEANTPTCRGDTVRSKIQDLQKDLKYTTENLLKIGQWIQRFNCKLLNFMVLIILSSSTRRLV